ncbi:MAG: hypothetical protein COA33_005675 [Fluviicola sp.]|nr:hypothetical protein [Fluviicola sp.]
MRKKILKMSTEELISFSENFANLDPTIRIDILSELTNRGEDDVVEKLNSAVFEDKLEDFNPDSTDHLRLESKIIALYRKFEDDKDSKDQIYSLIQGKLNVKTYQIDNAIKTENSYGRKSIWRGAIVLALGFFRFIAAITSTKSSSNFDLFFLLSLGAIILGVVLIIHGLPKSRLGK